MGRGNGPYRQTRHRVRDLLAVLDAYETSVSTGILLARSSRMASQGKRRLRRSGWGNSRKAHGLGSTAVVDSACKCERPFNFVAELSMSEGNPTRLWTGHCLCA